VKPGEISLIEKAFNKARFFEDYKIPTPKTSTEEMKAIEDNLDDLDFEDPYLDDFEQVYFDCSDLR